MYDIYRYNTTLQISTKKKVWYVNTEILRDISQYLAFLIRLTAFNFCSIVITTSFESDKKMAGKILLRITVESR
jgi:hypothetical protein